MFGVGTFFILRISLRRIVFMEIIDLYLSVSTPLNPWTIARFDKLYIEVKKSIASTSFCGLSTSEGFNKETIFRLGYDMRNECRIKGSPSIITISG